MNRRLYAWVFIIAPAVCFVVSLAAIAGAEPLPDAKSRLLERIASDQAQLRTAYEEFRYNPKKFPPGQRQMFMSIYRRESKGLKRLRKLVAGSRAGDLPVRLLELYTANLERRERYPQDLEPYLQIVGRDVVRHIFQAFETYRPQDKQRVLMFAARVGDPRALPLLEQALQDSDRTVRAAAENALHVLLGRNALPTLESSLTDAKKSPQELANTLKLIRDVAPEEWCRKFLDLLAQKRLAIHDGGFARYAGECPEELVANRVPRLLELWFDASDRTAANEALDFLGQLKSANHLRQLYSLLPDVLKSDFYLGAQMDGDEIRPGYLWGQAAPQLKRLRQRFEDAFVASDWAFWQEQFAPDSAAARYAGYHINLADGQSPDWFHEPFDFAVDVTEPETGKTAAEVQLTARIAERVHTVLTPRMSGYTPPTIRITPQFDLVKWQWMLDVNIDFKPSGAGFMQKVPYAGSSTIMLRDQDRTYRWTFRHLAPKTQASR